MADKKYSTTNNIGQSVAEGMMAFGDAMSGIYGQRGNTYGNYLDSQAKRQQMELEAQRYQQQQALAQQQLMLEKGKMRATIGENRSQAGLRSAQESYYNAQAKSQNALAGYYENLSNGGQTPAIDPITGQPTLSPDMVLSGIGPRGPRFDNLSVLAQKKQMEVANREYTATDAKAISQAEALVGKIGRLKEMVGTKAEGLGYVPFGGGTSEGQMFQSLKKDISNTLLYLRSGAQINEQEYKRLASQLPQLFRRKEVDKDQLDRFTEEFNGVLTRIKGGAAVDSKPLALKGKTKSLYDKYAG